MREAMGRVGDDTYMYIGRVDKEQLEVVRLILGRLECAR